MVNANMSDGIKNMFVKEIFDRVNGNPGEFYKFICKVCDRDPKDIHCGALYHRATEMIEKLKDLSDKKEKDMYRELCNKEFCLPERFKKIFKIKAFPCFSKDNVDKDSSVEDTSAQNKTSNSVEKTASPMLTRCKKQALEGCKMDINLKSTKRLASEEMNIWPSKKKRLSSVSKNKNATDQKSKLQKKDITSGVANGLVQQDAPTPKVQENASNCSGNNQMVQHALQRPVMQENTNTLEFDKEVVHLAQQRSEIQEKASSISLSGGHNSIHVPVVRKALQLSSMEGKVGDVIQKVPRELQLSKEQGTISTFSSDKRMPQIPKQLSQVQEIVITSGDDNQKSQQVHQSPVIQEKLNTSGFHDMPQQALQRPIMQEKRNTASVYYDMAQQALQRPVMQEKLSTSGCHDMPQQALQRPIVQEKLNTGGVYYDTAQQALQRGPIFQEKVNISCDDNKTVHSENSAETSEKDCDYSQEHLGTNDCVIVDKGSGSKFCIEISDSEDNESEVQTNAVTENRTSEVMANLNPEGLNKLEKMNGPVIQTAALYKVREPSLTETVKKQTLGALNLKPNEEELSTLSNSEIQQLEKDSDLRICEISELADRLIAEEKMNLLTKSCQTVISDKNTDQSSSRTAAQSKVFSSRTSKTTTSKTSNAWNRPLSSKSSKVCAAKSSKLSAGRASNVSSAETANGMVSKRSKKLPKLYNKKKSVGTFKVILTNKPQIPAKQSSENSATKASQVSSKQTCSNAAAETSTVLAATTSDLIEESDIFTLSNEMDNAKDSALEERIQQCIEESYPVENLEMESSGIKNMFIKEIFERVNRNVKRFHQVVCKLCHKNPKNINMMSLYLKAKRTIQKLIRLKKFTKTDAYKNYSNEEFYFPKKTGGDNEEEKKKKVMKEKKKEPEELRTIRNLQCENQKLTERLKKIKLFRINEKIKRQSQTILRLKDVISNMKREQQEKEKMELDEKRRKKKIDRFTQCNTMKNVISELKKELDYAYSYQEALQEELAEMKEETDPDRVRTLDVRLNEVRGNPFTPEIKELYLDLVGRNIPVLQLGPITRRVLEFANVQINEIPSHNVVYQWIKDKKETLERCERVISSEHDYAVKKPVSEPEPDDSELLSAIQSVAGLATGDVVGNGANTRVNENINDCSTIVEDSQLVSFVTDLINQIFIDENPVTELYIGDHLQLPSVAEYEEIS